MRRIIVVDCYYWPKILLFVHNLRFPEKGLGEGNAKGLHLNGPKNFLLIIDH